MQRRFDAGSVTLYDLKQVQAETENTRNHLEIAWNNYLQTSNALRRLLALRDEIVFVPEIDVSMRAD